jgi:hypothetical protein
MPPHKKSLWIFSRQLATFNGIGNIDRRYVGRLDSVLLNKGQPPVLRQIHTLPSSQPLFHFLNNPFPSRYGLVRGTQRQTQVSHRQRTNSTTQTKLFHFSIKHFLILYHINHLLLLFKQLFHNTITYQTGPLSVAYKMMFAFDNIVQTMYDEYPASL